MQQQLYFGIDIDGVSVDTPKLWLRWLEDMCEKKLGFEPDDYNYTKYFKDELAREGLDGFEFWRRENLYDSLEVHPKAVEVLTKLSDAGHKLVFVSTVKGFHHKSKWGMLERSGLPIEGFLATKEKHLVDVDILIDDSPYVISNVRAKSRREKFIIPFLAKYNETAEFMDECKTLAETDDTILVGWQLLDNLFKEAEIKL